MARSRGVKKIDNLRWSGFSSAFNGLSAGTGGITAATAGNAPETIMRTRGELTVYTDATQAPGGKVLISAGLIVMPEGTGTVVTSSPFSDSNAPWFWFEQVVIAYEEMVTDVIDVPVMTAARIVMDSKAMRRVRPDREIQLVVENTTLLGAMSVNLHLTGRFLFGT